MGLITEYINERMSVQDYETELIRLIKQYNKLTGTYLLIYSGATNKAIPYVSMSMADYYIIYDILKDVNSKDLDFYIETPGGSGLASEEIARFLRSKFENIRFVISGEAKSAGTILVLSGNEIMMTNSGSLGPIDAQIIIGRTQISAHDYLEWINEKREEADKQGN